MAKLTNVEKFAIQGMLASGIGVEEIAKNLKHSVKAVQTYADSLTASVQKMEANNVPVPEVPAEAAKQHALSTKELIATRRGSTVMTEAASLVADEARKQGALGPSRGAKGAIFKIKENTVE